MSVATAPLATLLVLPHLPNSNRIELRPDPTLESYAEYRNTYDALVSSDPLCAELTLPEEPASLLSCAQKNAFFRVFIDEQLAGFIAARPEHYRVWAGWNIVEELLHPTFRGKGYAAAMQQAFIKKLAPALGTAVFGTIDARNTPSLKTALRVGRQVAESGTFVFPSDGTRRRESDSSGSPSA